jgi:RNA polymerase sigma-70 factor (ECF subfamily)
MSAARDQLLDGLRPTAFAIAYRMLGRVAEAEDVVQEALLRLNEALEHGQRIESPRAYLGTVVTRLSIDALRSARVRRERYVGEWLPEPIVTDPAEDPARDTGPAPRRGAPPAIRDLAQAARRARPTVLRRRAGWGPGVARVAARPGRRPAW